MGNANPLIDAISGAVKRRLHKYYPLTRQFGSLGYSRLRNIGKNSPSRKNRIASHLNFAEYDFNFTAIIVVIIGRRLPDEVIYRIRLRVKANKSVAAIVEAVKVSKRTIYKLWLNLNI